jgi:hypothetical protein
MAWDYTWAVRTQDKSIDLRNEAGDFLYEILHSTISGRLQEKKPGFNYELSPEEFVGLFKK